MRILSLLIVLLLPAAVLAQKSGPLGGSAAHPIDLREAQLELLNVPIGVASADKASDFLQQHIATFRGPNIGVNALEAVESKGGSHFAFEQTWSGVPLYRSRSKVNMDRQGAVRSIINNSYDLSNQQLPTDFPAEATTNAWLTANGVPDGTVLERSNAYFPENAGFVATTRLEVLEGQQSYYEVFLDAAGNEVYFRDLVAYHHHAAPPPTDTTVLGNIFLPDPLSSAGVIYGGQYQDNDDADSQVLTNELVEVDVPAEYDNGVFYAENQWVKIVDAMGPSVDPHQSASDDWRVTRENDVFEDVMILYYLNLYKSYLDSLGHITLMAYQIEADAHSLNNADNSNFVSGGTPRLNFGEGGIDDAEDSDVIIHEYGHAISYSAAPGSNGGVARQAMDEAFGDYLAASYSKSITDWKWGKVYTWDGNNGNWNGRPVVSVKHYPEDVVNDIYQDAEIWSSTIMQVHNSIGRTKADDIMIQSMYAFEIGLTMAQAAELFIQADTILYNGLNYNSVCMWFELRGLYSNCVVGVDEAPLVKLPAPELLNSEGFANGETAQLQFQVPASRTITLYTADGRTVWTKQCANSTATVAANDLASGSYLLSVQAGQSRSVFKLGRH